MSDEEIDCDYTDDIVCPCCGNKHEAVDYAEGMDSSNCFEWECHKCEKTFNVRADYDVNFTSTKAGAA